MKLIYRGRNGDLYALPASHLENEDGGSAAQSDAIGRSGRGFPTSRSPWQMIFEMPCGVGMGVDIHWKRYLYATDEEWKSHAREIRSSALAQLYETPFYSHSMSLLLIIL